MITHYAEIHLQTLSPIGIRQVYQDGLGFPVLSETDNDIRVAITPHTTFHFTRSEKPVSPAHLAFEVRHATWTESNALLEQAHVALCGYIATDNTYQRYFKDGDGNLLEIYSHDYVNAKVLSYDNPLGVLYLREVGFVAEDVAGFWDWLGGRVRHGQHERRTGWQIQHRSGGHRSLCVEPRLPALDSNRLDGAQATNARHSGDADTRRHS